MAYTDTWNAAYEADPADGDYVSGGAEQIRDLKVAIRERLDKDHYFPNDGTDADMGEHEQVTLRVGSAPSNAADKGILYGKDVSGKCELHYIDEDGNEVQLTAGGAITPNQDIPSGTKMLIYADTAPTGWTIDNTLDDKAVMVTKGSAASGETGGGVHSSGTWTQPNHSHSHSHKWYDYNAGSAHLSGAGESWTPASTTNTGIMSSSVAGAKINTDLNTDTDATGGATANTWRPAAYCFIVCSKD